MHQKSIQFTWSQVSDCFIEKKFSLVKFYLLSREIIKYSRIVRSRWWKHNTMLSFRTKCLSKRRGCILYIIYYIVYCIVYYILYILCISFILRNFVCYYQKWSSNEKQILKFIDVRYNAIKILGIYLQPKKGQK